MILARSLFALRQSTHRVASGAQEDSIQRHCQIPSDSHTLSQAAITQMDSSADAYDHILQPSRTIADLDIGITHVAGVMQGTATPAANFGVAGQVELRREVCCGLPWRIGVYGIRFGLRPRGRFPVLRSAV